MAEWETYPLFLATCMQASSPRRPCGLSRARPRRLVPTRHTAYVERTADAVPAGGARRMLCGPRAVSYTHLRAHETLMNL
eukprot:1903236-Prymnesium_polylepis.1